MKTSCQDSAMDRRDDLKDLKKKKTHTSVNYQALLLTTVSSIASFLTASGGHLFPAIKWKDHFNFECPEEKMGLSSVLMEHKTMFNGLIMPHFRKIAGKLNSNQKAKSSISI